MKRQNNTILLLFLLFNSLLINQGSYCLENTKKISSKIKNSTKNLNSVNKKSEKENSTNNSSKKPSGQNIESAKFVGDIVNACYKSVVETISPDFCWVKNGNFGLIPSGCPTGWTKTAAHCYRNCRRDFQYNAGRCYNGWKSYQPDLISNFSDMVSCPVGYYKSGALCYKDCRSIGMENCGIGACVSNSANCGMTIASMALDTVMGVASFVTEVLTFGAASGATLAAQAAAKAGMKQLTNTVKKQAFEKIKTSFSKYFKETVKKAKKAFIENLKDIPTQLGAEFLATTYCSAVYDSIKSSLEKKSEPKKFDLEAFGKKLDVLGVGSIVENCRDSSKGAECAKSSLETAANFDPSGLLTIAAAFVHPTCEISSNEERIEVRKVLNNFRTLCENNCKSFLTQDILGDKHVVLLDRHNVQCPDKSLLNSVSFKILDKLIVEYRCYNSNNITNICKTQYTQWDEFRRDSGSVDYLDRHNIECSDNAYLLKGFNLEVNHSSLRMRVRYTCCYVNNYLGYTNYQTNRNYITPSRNLDNFKNTDAIQGSEKGALKGLQMRSGDNKWRFDYKFGWFDFDPNLDSAIFEKQTDWNDAGEGSIWFLDRHKLDCLRNNSAIAGFFFERSGNRIRYNYQCIENKKISNECYEDNTPWNDVDGDERKSVHFLDRHRVQCKIDHVLRAFSVQRSPRPNNFIRYSFKCCKTAYINKNTNRFDKTDLGNFNTFYLDRQRISLGPDEVLSAFKLDTYFNPNLMNYVYEYYALK